MQGIPRVGSCDRAARRIRLGKYFRVEASRSSRVVCIAGRVGTTTAGYESNFGINLCKQTREPIIGVGARLSRIARVCANTGRGNVAQSIVPIAGQKPTCSHVETTGCCGCIVRLCARPNSVTELLQPSQAVRLIRFLYARFVCGKNGSPGVV